MNTERKIIFFDVDGTIYEGGRGTPESTRKALERLKENGHIPILCTGRPKASMFPEVLDLNFPGMICGAGTYMEYEGRILRNLLLPNEVLMQEVPRLEKAGCCVVLEGPEYLSCRADQEAFRLMKPTAVLVNTARGAVVDEQALIQALSDGQIAMAGLDVTEQEPVAADNPLLKLDNAVVTPHAAWYSEEAVASLQRKVAEEAARVLRGETPQNPVNHPKL